MNPSLLQQVKSLIEAGRSHAVRQVNSTITTTYFLIGRYIVEDEQRGETRAGYATETLKFLSTELTKTFGRGFSQDNLENMRRFYLAFQSRLEASDKGIWQTLSAKSEKQISETLSRKFTFPENLTFNLSWSHYILLSRIGNEGERSFYEKKPSPQIGACASCSGNTTARFTNALRCPAIKATWPASPPKARLSAVRWMR